MNYIPLVISLLALTVSTVSLWLTKLRRGKVKMTRPTFISLSPDEKNKAASKVYMRMLLYSTAEQGTYIQNMYVRLQRGESIQNFNVWGFDEKGLVRGSGLFVNKNGLAAGHYFTMPNDGSQYDFLAGSYTIQIFVECVNSKPRKIFEQSLSVSNDQAVKMKGGHCGLSFNWAPSTENYSSYLENELLQMG